MASLLLCVVKRYAPLPVRRKEGIPSLWVDCPIPRIGGKRGSNRIYVGMESPGSPCIYEHLTINFSISGAATAIVGAVKLFFSRSKVRARTGPGFPQARGEEEAHLLEQSGAPEIFALIDPEITFIFKSDARASLSILYLFFLRTMTPWLRPSRKISRTPSRPRRTLSSRS